MGALNTHTDCLTCCIEMKSFKWACEVLGVMLDHVLTSNVENCSVNIFQSELLIFWFQCMFHKVKKLRFFIHSKQQVLVNVLSNRSCQFPTKVNYVIVMNE